MSIRNFSRGTVLLLFSVFSCPLSAFSQGSLTPPAGTPTPTMKTLDQIEARTPISSLPYAINSPGSYYLTANLSVSTGDAIAINTNQVTLDLNGFTISSTASPASGNAILLAASSKDITIINGHIKGGVGYSNGSYSGSGFLNGINVNNPGGDVSYAPFNVRVSGVSVSGCLGSGIFLNAGSSTVVESSTVQTVGNYGINVESVSHSSANQCGGTAISASVIADCIASSTGSSAAVSANIATGCFAIATNGYAVSATNAVNCYGISTTNTAVNVSNALNCYGSSTTGTGISASTATNCQGSSGNAGYGVNAITANACYGISSTGIGIHCTSGMAIGCVGINTSNNTHGLNAYIANCCVYSPTLSVSYKYNMP
jgi:hypothetical protein